jgi:hypothetical protein
MHQRLDAASVLAAHRHGEVSDSLLIREIAGVPTRLMAGADEGFGPRRRLFELAIDEHQRGALIGEGTRYDFTNLAFGTNASQDDGQSGEHCL